MTFRMTGSTLAFAMVLAACGGGSDGTTPPAAVAATVTVSMASPDPFLSLTETRTATAQVRDANGAAISNAAVTWSTSDAAVATVSGSGTSATITSVGNGTATITARSGTVQGTVAVTVAQRLATLAVTGAPATMAIGVTAPLTASPRDARNAVVAGAAVATYSTSSRAVAIVDAAGVVTAIAPGSATITASLTRDGATANGTANITVGAPPSLSATGTVSANVSNAFTPATVTVGVGGTVSWTFAVDHNVLFSGGLGAPSDIPVTSTGVVSRTFGTVGTFPYTCTLHAGMNGTVIVAEPTIFAEMNGANERPNATNSTANGAAVFTRNGANVAYTVTYQGMASIPTGLHIHAPATTSTNAGIIVDLVTSPLTSASGVLTGSFTASAIRSIGGQPPISMDSLFVLLRTGSAYVNVHSSAFLAGEIRGQTSQR